MVAAYHHPDLGLIIANPKVAEELANFGMLRKRELLVLFAGKGSTPADDNCQKAAELAVSLFAGKKAKVPPELFKGNFTVKKLKKAEEEEEKPAKAAKAPKAAKPGKPAAARAGRAKAAAPPAPKKESARVAPPAVTAAAPAISKGPLRMTPMYSVLVSNELFHNGNVEAWKKIIASYNAKYPALQVFIYYEGERILDINTLFKWGKVKHGSSIQFAVSGNEIMDVAKLQRYLIQGASQKFEAFLHGPVNSVLRLFG
jgi:nucleoid-associated protein YgaU